MKNALITTVLVLSVIGLILLSSYRRDKQPNVDGYSITKTTYTIGKVPGYPESVLYVVPRL